MCLVTTPRVYDVSVVVPAFAQASYQLDQSFLGLVIEIVRNWTDPGLRVELPSVPRLGDTIVINDEWDGTVEEVVWEPGEPVKVRIG